MPPPAPAPRPAPWPLARAPGHAPPAVRPQHRRAACRHLRPLPAACPAVPCAARPAVPSAARPAVLPADTCTRVVPAAARLLPGRVLLLPGPVPRPILARTHEQILENVLQNCQQITKDGRSGPPRAHHPPFAHLIPCPHLIHSLPPPRTPCPALPCTPCPALPCTPCPCLTSRPLSRPTSLPLSRLSRTPLPRPLVCSEHSGAGRVVPVVRPAARRNHRNVTLPWPGQQRCHIAVAARGGDWHPGQGPARHPVASDVGGARYPPPEPSLEKATPIDVADIYPGHKFPYEYGAANHT
jgi:hypothetical protein